MGRIATNTPHDRWIGVFCVSLLCSGVAIAGEEPQPKLPPGFHAQVIAREPLLRNPAAMVFDRRGRLFVGQGPQYREPTPQTPGDDVRILIDSDGDGVADHAQVFASGFNCIQGLAWHGRDLWVANSPELTIVRDLDGDDVADEYVVVYGGLGNLEHALTTLTWGPDGRLYLSKGNSRGLMSGERIAPKPFRELWGVTAPPGTPDHQPPQTFRAADYRHGWQNPADDWGREGGVLRCDDLGANLEIVSRGLRNPWRIAYDDGFDFIGTDQDQDAGDRIVMPFMDAHFGWGHRWSAHWTGSGHLPTVPISGPVFHGSGTGVVYYDHPQFPPQYRGVFFINDWLKRQITVYRPRWDGALRQSDTRELEVFASAGQGRAHGESSGILFDLTDLTVGPDGALYTLSWGHRYGATFKDGKQVDEGCVWRISYGDAKPAAMATKHERPSAQWTVPELIDDLRHDRLPVWRSDAQDELVRRGALVLPDLVRALATSDNVGVATWLAWTIGRIDPQDAADDALFIARSRASGDQTSAITARVQALRILGYRCQRAGRPLPVEVSTSLTDAEPRVRMAAIDAIAAARQKIATPGLITVLASESDRVVFYRAWRALGHLMPASERRALLTHAQAGVRLGALLALLEDGALTGDEVVPLRLDPDQRVAALAGAYVAKVGTAAAPLLTSTPKPGDYSDEVAVTLATSVAGTEIRYTTDGSDPTFTATLAKGPLAIARTQTIRAALFRAGERVGAVLEATYRVTAPATRNDAVPLTHVSTTSGRAALTASTGLQRGGRVYHDRDYTWREIPKVLRGATVIQTSNEDDASRGDTALRFTVDQPVEVLVAHDRRLPRRPAWMADFTATPFTLASEDTTYALWQHTFPAGEVVLGGNLPDGDQPARSNYLVVVRPAPLTGTSRAVTLAEVVPLVAGANRDLGRRLFLGVAGCSACHRVGTQGAQFAPDLSDLGSRGEAKTVVEAILDPNASITEGFQAVSVTTRDGRAFLGVVREETDLVLVLVQADGKPMEVRKADIATRTRSAVSIMPGGFGQLLDAHQVAAIAAWLLDQRVDRPPTSAPASAPANGPRTRITITPEGDDLRVDLDGALFTRYRTMGLRSPVLHPLLAAGGVNVVRDYPLVKGTPGEVQDHTWHTALWFSHASVGGLDFWRDTPATTANRVVPSGAPRIIAGPTPAIVAAHEWRAGDGRVVCRDRRVIRFSVDGDTRAIDYQVTLSAPADRELVLGDTEEGTMAIRTHPALALTGNGARGNALNSSGVRGKDVWGKRAAWVDYWAPFGDATIGVALLDHPDNPRHPTWWHARDYGLITANPLGVHDFEGKPAGTGDLRLAAGQEVTFRWRFLIHRGDAATAGIAQRFAAFAAEPQLLPEALPKAQP